MPCAVCWRRSPLETATYEDYIHEDYLNPDSLERSDSRGPRSFEENVEWLHDAFSDIKFSELEQHEGHGIVLKSGSS